jgi:hypothetical protein
VALLDFFRVKKQIPPALLDQASRSCAEALVRAKFVKGGRVADLAFKNTHISANIVETFYLPTEWT